jgi:hypothetical protein
MYFEHGQGSIQAIFFSTFVKRKDPLNAIKDDEWSCDVIKMKKKKNCRKARKKWPKCKKETVEGHLIRSCVPFSCFWILYLSMLLLESFSKN